MKPLLLVIAALSITGCGYRLATPGIAQNYSQISVPYIKGDTSGLFTDYLTRELAARGRFNTKDNSRYKLICKIVRNDKEQIGWRYDRDATNNTRIQRLRPVESQRIMAVEVSLLDTYSGNTVYGPKKVHSNIDYDYVNFDTISDLAFRAPGSSGRSSTLDFSLGQLDAVENADIAALDPLYRNLSKLIADGLDACAL